MPYVFKLPDLGEGIHEGEVKKWLVKEGDKIMADQPLAELETDKAVVEVPSPKSGTILKLHANEGGIIEVGGSLVTILEEGEEVHQVIPFQEKTIIVPVKEKEDNIITVPYASHAIATPYVRKLAREFSVDIEKIPGSGAGGRVTEEDIRSAAGTEKIEFRKEKPTVSNFALPNGEVEHISFRGIRKTIADRMLLSQRTVAAVTHMDEIDVSELAIIREKEKAEANKKSIKLTYLPFVIKAVISGLREYPIFNSLLDYDKGEILFRKYYHIGVAVDIEDGLIVPVIKNAERKTILQIAMEISELAEKARSRKLALEEMKGGTFTITNIGSIGGTYATPIINYSEVAILGLGKISDRPVVKNGQIQIRKIMNVSLTFDHRVADGAQAARFVNVIKKHLEDPGLLMIDE